jgi:hypothetical protein
MKHSVRLLVLAALLPLAPARPSFAEDVAAAVHRYDGIKAGGSSVAVRDLALKSGHATWTLKTGQITPVRAGEEVVGLYFEGTGAFEYRSVDAIEHPIVSYEARKVVGLTPEKVGADLVLRDSFQRLLWLCVGRPLPELPGGQEMWVAGSSRVEASVAVGPSLETSFRAHREKFSRTRMSPLTHRFASRLANAPGSPLVVAELDGGKEALRYLFDGYDEMSEALVALVKRSTSDAELRLELFPIILSDQPVGRDRRDPVVPWFALTEVAVDIKASDGKEVEILVAETLVPQKRPLSVVRMDLDNRTYGVTGIGRLDPRDHRVREVWDESGKKLSFHHSRGEIVVGLATPAPPDKPVKLRFEIEGDFLIRPGGDNFWQLGVEPWFPQPDLAGQYYTFHAKVKVKKPFVPFAPGKTIARREEGDSNVLETAIDEPIQFAIVMAGKYQFEEETRSGLTVRVASYAGKNTRAIKQLTNLAFGIIDDYQRFLGPFPFPVLDILEINDYGFGQAPPATMFITKEAFNPLLGEENQFFSQGINERFAHEIAHQYWGHAVKMPSLEEQWLTEAFAEYSAAIFLKDFRGKATYDRLVSFWKGRASHATDISPIALVNRVDLPGDRLETALVRQDLLYWKGAYLLAALHKELGDETFLTFLKSYQKSFRWKFGSTRHVEGLLQFMTKKDWGPWFEKYYWGTGMP